MDRVVPACAVLSRSSVQQMKPVRIWFRTTGFFPKEKHFCSRLRSRILLTVLLNWSGIASRRDFSRHFPMQTAPGQRQARLALDYIQKNYMDPDLSLNSICSYLNISTSYFSTIFKDLTGETFTEVLIRTRMEKAKELLEIQL